MEMILNLSSIEQKKSPLCSVCIANYNGEEIIEQCIESILKQEKFSGEYEIIVHDDASTDNSITLIKTRYPQVRLLSSDQNVGFCVSNNRMVAVAEGEFILLLNNDATLHVDALRTLHEASVLHGDGIYGLPQYDAATGELIDIGSILDPFLNPIPNKNVIRKDVGMVIGACLFLPKSLWNTLGGFPEWFGSLAEDVYICCLARLRGFKVTAVPHSGFDHWVGQSFGGGKITENQRLFTTYARRFLSERNKSYVMITCYPSSMAWLLIPLHFMVLSLEGISLSLIKWDVKIWQNIYWLAMQEVWKNRRKICCTRTVNQRLRAIPFWVFFRQHSFIPHKIRMLLKFGLPQLIQK